MASGLPVSVNLSTRDLIDADLPAQISRTIDRAGLDPSLLWSRSPRAS